MATQTQITPAQYAYIKAAYGIVHALEDSTCQTYLNTINSSNTQLNERQLQTIESKFSEGLNDCIHRVKNHSAPIPFIITKVAIIANFLENQYPKGAPLDSKGEVTLSINDFVASMRLLAQDVQTHVDARNRWENAVNGIFQAQHGVSTHPKVDQSVQSAESIGKVIAKSLGVDGVFNNIYKMNVTIPPVAVDPLPEYAAKDPRSQNLALMAELQQELSVTLGMLNVITPPDKGSDREKHMLQWLEKRANTAIESIRKVIIPTGIVRFSSQLNDTAKVLAHSRDMLQSVIYGSEHDLANTAAQYAVERSWGTIAFLAVCPNIPFLIPTLELRIAFTKPIYFLTKSAHEALGNIFIFGFAFWILRGMGYLIDAIPRAQVRLVQDFVTDMWLADDAKRTKLINRYLKFVSKRAKDPTVDALQQVFLSIVS